MVRLNPKNYHQRMKRIHLEFKINDMKIIRNTLYGMFIEYISFGINDNTGWHLPGKSEWDILFEYLFKSRNEK
jgi:hypothetical protein